MQKSKSFWITLCLVNLAIVALLGFVLRSKIVFSLPFIDYRSLISAHSHFAFGGWVGLSILTLFIFNLLPAEIAHKKKYFWLLAGIEISSLGMAFSFPNNGYTPVSIFFSSLYIIATYFFAPVFLKDFLKLRHDKTIRLLTIAAIVTLLISAIGPLGLSYILLSKSGNSILYRDSIYTFLHFQYNGFFTLGIFALLFHHFRNAVAINGNTIYRFSLFLTISIVPSLFLSLLWHNEISFYILAAAGCVCIVISLYYFIRSFKLLIEKPLFNYRLARTLLVLSLLSFIVKMILHTGTILPHLGNAIYGNRPVIIGFLHLIFLGFVSFYLLSTFIESGLLTSGNKLFAFPVIIFSAGIIANEAILMLQGLEILFQSNKGLYNWLLWVASIILFIGATAIAIARLVAWQKSKT